MSHSKTLKLILLGALVVHGAAAKPRKKTPPKPKVPPAPYELLPASDLAKLKKGSCTFIHLWATWCTVCLQELPDLIKALNVDKRVNPVVIDVSSTFVQENFSKKWILTLKPSFKVYLKPPGKDDAYMEAVDKEWGGVLPFSVLYHGGTRRKVWNGSVDLAVLRAELDAVCR